MAKTELAPCPFCGGKAVVYKDPSYLPLTIRLSLVAAGPFVLVTLAKPSSSPARRPRRRWKGANHMAIKPMLFNTEMVRAILSGQKTCTRRVVKPRYKEDEGGFQINTNVKTGERWVEKSDWDEGSFDPPRYVNPPCRPGDILYVRETWNGTTLGNAKVGYTDLYWYKADDESQNPADKWRPSIHMPKEAARIFLRVTDVRVERLQEITVDGCKTEGIKPLEIGTEAQGFREPQAYLEAFEAVWDSTIKYPYHPRYGWAANPWVWVIEFERTSKEAALKKESKGEHNEANL